MRSFSWLATLMTVCAVVAVAPLASAQVTAVTVTTTGITRQLANGSYYPSHIVDGTYQGIGFQDCTSDTDIVFPITIAGLPDSTVTFEIWAGTGDCTQAGATNNASTGTCWPLSLNPPPASVMTIPIHVRDIVSQLGITPPMQSYAPAPAAVCSAASSTTTTVSSDSGTTTTSGEATVNVFFMFFPNGSSTPSVSSAAYPLKVKLSGPAACTNVTAGSGDGLLIVDWNPPVGETDIQGYDLFAQPAGLGADASVIATTGCSGTIDASSAATTCADGGVANLTCTQVSGTTNGSGTISGLTNGTSYTVGVAAFDEFGNTGTISSVACATPQPVDDFWKIYSQNGGGTGSCALETIGSRGSPAAAAAVAIAATVMLRRRKRRAS
jgi:hypothetical protein